MFFNVILIVVGTAAVLAIATTQTFPLAETWNNLVFFGGFILAVAGIMRILKRLAPDESTPHLPKP